MPKLYTPKEIRHILGLTQKQMSKLTGLSPGTIVNLESQHKSGGIKYETAKLFAEAAACDVTEVKWPRPFTEQGRQPLTGGQYIMTRTTITVEVVEVMCCPRCHYVLPVTGLCDECAG